MKEIKMSRLRKRLERYQTTQPEPQPIPYDYYNQEQQPYVEEAPSPLVQQYEELQKRAEKHQAELRAIESTNPHSLYKDVVTRPSQKGKFATTIMGRPIDMSKLENYLVYRISPRSVTTLMRYNDSLVRSEVLGFGKRRPIKMKSGILWIIIGAALILLIGYFLMTQDMSGMFQGMFGM
jgi:hypothetical protein